MEMEDSQVKWLLKKERVCQSCGSMFLKNTSVGSFLRHIQSCGKLTGSRKHEHSEHPERRKIVPHFYPDDDQVLRAGRRYPLVI